MGLRDVVNSAVNKTREVFNGAEQTVRNTARTIEKPLPSISQFNSVAQNITGRIIGSDPVTEATRKSIGTVQKLVFPRSPLTPANPVNDIAKAGKGLFERFREPIGNAFNRLVDTGRTFVRSFGDGLTGLGTSVLEGAGQILSGGAKILNPFVITSALGKAFSGDFSGAFNDVKNNFVDGLKDIGRGFVKGTVQAAADTGIVWFNGAVSGLQTLAGLEPPSRPLTNEEIGELKKVYGDSLDYSQIRLKEGHLGIKNGMAPHTVGNTIYIPKGWLNPKDPNYNAERNKLLVHEAAHSWQFQNGGTDYIGESLWNQAIGALTGGSRDAAYEFEKPIKEGKSWSQLNPEQQAHLIDQAYKNGMFDDSNKKWILSDGTDITSYVRDAIAQMRKGQGAP